MFYNVLNVKDTIGSDGGNFKKQTLMEHDDSSLNAVAIKKDAVIDTHTSAADAAVLVVDGEIELHFDAEKFKIKKGEMLMFKKDVQHKVVALKDSKFLIVKI